MGEYRRGAHAVYDSKYHLIWITKYRYKVLRGRVAERARELIRQSCQVRHEKWWFGARCRRITCICWSRRRQASV